MRFKRSEQNTSSDNISLKCYSNLDVRATLHRTIS